MMLGDAEFGTGGYYELVIEIGSPDERLGRAVDALWSHPDLDVRHLVANENGTPGLTSKSTAWRRGEARLPDGTRLPCRSFAEVIGDREGETAYVIFALPMSALERAFAPEKERTPAALDPAWRRALENWLAGLGSHVDRSVPFKAAYIGFLPFPIGVDEMADVLFADEIPEERCLAYLYRWENELRYFPTTRWS